MKTLLVAVLLPLTLSATMIQWYCVPGSDLVDSQGQPLGSDFRFELGVFKTGFVPTLENRAEWSANWVAAQRAVYDPVNRWYTAVFTVTDNSGEFAVNKEAWVWGFAGDGSSGEWILFRNASWRWPRANPHHPVARTWNSRGATIFLAGGGGGESFHLRSEAVEGLIFPVTTWGQWLAEEGVGSPAEGVPAVLRYVLGVERLEELLAKRMTLEVLRTTEGRVVQLRIPRRADRPASFVVETSGDLVTWRPVSLRVHENGPQELILRDEAILQENAPIGFWRYRVTPRN